MLSDYGERTPLELEKIEWAMKKAAQELYRAAVDVFIYQGQLLKMVY